MCDAGIRGIRPNLPPVGPGDPVRGRAQFEAAVERMRRRGWHVQIHTVPSMIAAVRDLVETSPVPVVFDHFGGVVAAHGLQQPGFADLVDLVAAGRAYVKISGAYRSSDLAPAYADIAPFAKALITANPDRILWGTDWPHPSGHTPPGRKPTDVTPLLQIDDGRHLDQLGVWAPDAAVRRKILVDNPARLYEF